MMEERDAIRLLERAAAIGVEVCSTAVGASMRSSGGKRGHTMT